MSQEADSFFDFDIEQESPGSPADECEYIRLIETASTTPHDAAPESGYVCASPISPEGSLESQSSSDGPYYDPETSDAEKSVIGDYFDCVEAKNNTNNLIMSNTSLSPSININQNNFNNHNNSNNINNSSSNCKIPNGHLLTTTTPTDNTTLSNNNATMTFDSDSCSESLPPSQSDTCTAPSSASNSTLQDEESDTIEPIMNNLHNDGGEENGIETCENENKKDEEIYTNGDGDNGDVRHDDILNGEEPKVEKSDESTVDEPMIIYDNGLIGNCLVNGLEDDPNVVDQLIAKAEIQADFDLEQKQNHENNLLETEQISSTSLQIEQQYILDCLNVIDATPDTSESENLEKDTSNTNNESNTNGDCLTVPESNIEHLSASTDDDEVEESRPQRVRRCSSLKTGKTPPGTPGRKKIVRFADVLGLDLADVRTFMDEVPKIPKSAYDDLVFTESSEQLLQQQLISLGPRADKVLLPLFQQPGGLPNFLEAVRDKQVSLENAAIIDPICLTIAGCVRVRNLDFHKSVHIRYSLDGWKSFSDLQANYVENSCDGFSDKFSFTMFGNALQVGQHLELSVRFQCKGQQFWDNNYGQNYIFQCLPSTTPRSIRAPILPSDEWCQSFY